MATSGTTSFVPSFDDLLAEAWERLGLSSAILTGDVVRAARRSLQLMLIDWTNRNAPLWQIDFQGVVLTPGTALYAAPAGTADVLDLWVTAGGFDLMLQGIGRDEFAAIPNKIQAGRPTTWWSERQRDLPVIHLWPVPDLAYSLGMNRLRLPQDIGMLSATPDAPVLWAEAMAAGLAARLALKFKPDRYVMLKQDALDAWVAANGEDRERVALTVMPDLRPWR